MASNFHPIYAASKQRMRVALFACIGVLSVAFGMLVFSPAAALVFALALCAIAVAWWKPEVVVAALAWYLPFEPFLLKWVPDDVYILARYAPEFGIYALCGVVVWRWFAGRTHGKRTPIDAPFLGFCAVLLVSAVANAVPFFQAALGIRQILRFILLFFVVVALRPSLRWVRVVLVGMALVIGVQVALGYAQATVGAPLDQFLLPSERKVYGDIQLTSGTWQFWDPGQRVFGTMGRYDQLSTFLAFFLLIAVAFLYERVGKARMRWWLGAGIALVLPVLALTYSRSAWFGFVLGFLFIAALVKRDVRIRIVAVVVPVLLAGYVAVSGLAVNTLIDTANQSLVHRFYEAFSRERWVGEYYGLGRAYWIVQTVTHVVPASPVFGHGPARYGAGAVVAIGDRTVYERLGLPYGVYGTDGYIDNNWLSLWGEAGTLGLALYLWMYVALFVACMRVYTRSDDPETRALALGVAAAMLAIALNAALATMLEVRTLATYLWVMAGVVVALGQQQGILKDRYAHRARA